MTDYFLLNLAGLLLKAGLLVWAARFTFSNLIAIYNSRKELHKSHD